MFVVLLHLVPESLTQERVCAAQSERGFPLESLDER